MKNIFTHEEKVIFQAEERIKALQGECVDKNHYEELLHEYQLLLRQISRMVKMSDLMHTELKAISENYEVISYIDGLTGIHNRRYFDEAYVKEWNNAMRVRGELAVLMIDIDYFKKYNDAYGHLKGDDCLRKVAMAIKQTVNRPRDIVARFGGEEFIVLLPDTSSEGALFIGNSIMEMMKELAIAHETSTIKPYVTVSIGACAVYPNDMDTQIDLLNLVDQALYRAKSDGRNCIRVV